MLPLLPGPQVTDLREYFALRGAAHAIPRIHHDHLIAAYATFIGARNVVELGTGPGYATRVLLGVTMRFGGHLWSVDIADAAGRGGLRDHPGVTFVTGDSVEYARRYAAMEGPPPDLVYLDSDHSRAHVLAELRAWAALKPRAMFVDDTLDPNEPHGSPLEAVVDFCREAAVWSWWNIPIHTGLAILVPSDPNGASADLRSEAIE